MVSVLLSIKYKINKTNIEKKNSADSQERLTSKDWKAI